MTRVQGATTSRDSSSLTPWLHELIQNAAGRTVADDPLTFKDLWDAPGFPDGLSRSTRARSIDLQMFTTNLAHGRPYLLPHCDKRARLFYDGEELMQYLPPKVMKWIDEHARAYAPSADSTESDPPRELAQAKRLKELPVAEDFPVLLAARMSLSFPLLISAVPLWAIDYDAPPGQPDFERCMFSDGGICSNFPIHLFDGLVPRWPTFGIQLETKPPNEDVFLPKRYQDGYRERWYRFDVVKNAKSSRMAGFFSAIVNTMQNWNDNALSRMAGVRDRVVRVRLANDEGGMNLNMEKYLIEKIAGHGADAAAELIERFVSPNVMKSSAGWNEQRWVRLDVLLETLNNRLPGVGAALGPTTPHTMSYAALVDTGLAERLAGHCKLLSPEQRDALKTLFTALESVAQSFEQQSAAYSPKAYPAPDLRVRPPL